MKRSFAILLAAVAAVLLFVACSPDAKTTASISYEDFVGTWIYGDTITGDDAEYIEFTFNDDHSASLVERKDRNTEDSSAGTVVTVSGSTVTIDNGKKEWKYTVEFKDGKLILKQVGDSTWIDLYDLPEITLDRYYTIKFNSNGGTTVYNQKVKSGNKLTAPTAPTKTNLLFAGWTTDENGTSYYDFDTAVSADITLYAKWVTSFAVGDRGPSGGYIFYVAGTEQSSTYVDSSGASQNFTWKYLEAAPSNLTITNEDGTTTEEIRYFGYYLTEEDEYGETNYTPAIVTTENSDGNQTNAAIGQGRYNTTKLVKAMGSSAYKDMWNNDGQTAIYAAKVCADYNGGGYSDWFLPSLKELKEMYNHKEQIGGTWHAGSSVSEAYWSSSENSSQNVWTLKFSDGSNWNATRSSDSKYVRAIRAF